MRWNFNGLINAPYDSTSWSPKYDVERDWSQGRRNEMKLNELIRLLLPWHEVKLRYSMTLFSVISGWLACDSVISLQFKVPLLFHFFLVFYMGYSRTACAFALDLSARPHSLGRQFNGTKVHRLTHRWNSPTWPVMTADIRRNHSNIMVLAIHVTQRPMTWRWQSQRK